MANNIRAVSPSLFSFSQESLSLSLSFSLGPARYHLFVQVSLASLLRSLLSRRLQRPFASELWALRVRIPSWFTDAVLDTVATHPGARHIRLLASSYSPYAHEVVCAARKSRFCVRGTGYVRQWRLLSDAGKKGVIRGLLNALLVRYK